MKRPARMLTILAFFVWTFLLTLLALSSRRDDRLFQKYLAKPIDLPELVAAIVMLSGDPSSDLNSSDPTRTARAA